MSKVKSNDNSEYSPVYFNSTTKTGINSDKLGLDQSFQAILYKLDNWINEGSGWIIEEIHSQYLNVSTYSALIGSTYIELPSELTHPKKALINIQNNDNRCFLWCHIRHFKSVDKNLQRMELRQKNYEKTF